DPLILPTSDLSVATERADPDLRAHRHQTTRGLLQPRGRSAPQLPLSELACWRWTMSRPRTSRDESFDTRLHRIRRLSLALKRRPHSRGRDVADIPPEAWANRFPLLALMDDRRPRPRAVSRRAWFRGRPCTEPGE